MKLSTFLLVCSMGVAQATGSYAQKATVNLEMRNQTVQQVLDEIEEQSDFSFFFNIKHVDLDRRVSVVAKKSDIFKVLDTVFAGTDVAYSVVDNKIILSTKKLEVQQITQDKKVTGVVKDQHGEPVIGANVSVKGTTIGTITGIDGDFVLEVPEDAVIQVSYIGYVSQELRLGGKKQLNVVLRENSQALDEVVVVGYGVQKKANLTGAVASISSEELESKPMSNLGQGIQGLVPNVNITMPGNGNPGLGTNFNIRGVTSLSGGGPLILVDGVQMDPNMINPQDIETMSFLKDAAASSIYGARAAYGVILITTKKGKNGTPKISYSSNMAFNSPTFLPQPQNSIEWAETINRGMTNLGNNPFVSDLWLQKIKEYAANPETAPNWYPDPNGYVNQGGGNFNYCGNVDWVDAIYKKSAFMHQHTVAIQGGTEKNSYYASIGYNNQNGFLRYADEPYEKINTKINLSSQITSWLKIGVNSFYNTSYKKNPAGVFWGSNPDGGRLNYSSGGSFGGTWPVVPITHSGYAGLNDPNPSYNVSWTNSIQCQRESGKEETKVKDFWIGGTLDLNPFKGLNVHVDYMSNTKKEDYKIHVKKMKSQDPITGKWSSMVHSKNNWISMSEATNNYYALNAYADYSFDIQEHNFKIMLGVNNEKNHYKWFWARHMDLINNDFPAMNQATGAEKTNYSENEWAVLGYFGRLNYNFEEKYFLELNARYDGSSRFPRNNKFGFFPSLSAGWTLSKETFFEKIADVVNTVKLRASWGELGNIPSSDDIGIYPYVPTLGTINQISHIIDGNRPVGISPAALTTNMTWETVRQWNVGLDFGVLNNQLTGSFDYYNRWTFGMIGTGTPLPSVLGTSVPLQNASDLVTRGWELSVNWRGKIKDDFNYNVGFVLSDNSSEIKKFDNPTGLLSTRYVGQKIGEIWGYQSDGVFQTDEEAAEYQSMYDVSQITGRKLKAGDVRYLDTNGDKKITPALTLDNTGDQSIIGNSEARYSYGINLGADWKGFDLRVFFQGIGKRDVNVSSISNLYDHWQETYSFMSDTWTPENPNAFWPRVTVGDSGANTQTRTTGLQSAAYLRLKDVTLGYSLPKSLIGKLSLQNVRIYFSGYNLLTITPLHEGLFDPELLSVGAYPIYKSLSFGIDIVL